MKVQTTQTMLAIIHKFQISTHIENKNLNFEGVVPATVFSSIVLISSDSTQITSEGRFLSVIRFNLNLNTLRLLVYTNTTYTVFDFN